MSLEHAILGFLNYHPYSGYDLKKVFDHSVQPRWKLTGELDLKDHLSRRKGARLPARTSEPNLRLVSDFVAQLPIERHSDSPLAFAFISFPHVANQDGRPRPDARRIQLKLIERLLINIVILWR